jgi:hypothetical protein
MRGQILTAWTESNRWSGRRIDEVNDDEKAGSAVDQIATHLLSPSCEQHHSAVIERDPVRKPSCKLREAGLERLRFHDLRHTSLTNHQNAAALLARSEGRRSEGLSTHSSQRRPAEDEAANQSGEAPGVHVTNHVSIADELELGGVQVPDLFGGADGARTRDLRRDRPLMTRRNRMNTEDVAFCGFGVTTDSCGFALFDGHVL